MSILDWFTCALLIAAIFFFLAGTVALFRFPDLYSRLHALTKADNVGLGFTVIAIALQASTWLDLFKLALIWLTVLITSACISFLIANEARRRGVPPWSPR